MEKAILLGSSFSALPILKNLKTLNLYVIVCGNNPNDVCVNLADEYLNVNYANKENLYKELKNKKFDYLIPSCNDLAYISGSYIAEKLSLPGYDSYKTANLIFKKNFYRKFLNKNNIRSPKLINLNHKLKYPFIIKPIDSFSGKGIFKINNAIEMQNTKIDSILNSKRSKIVAEEYIKGTLHSHSAFIKKNKIIADFFVDEFCTTYKYQVNCSNYPSLISARIKTDVRSEISKIINLLNLKNGLFHTQFIIKKNEIYIVESMRRCPGDLYPELIIKSTNHNYWKYYISSFLGEDVKLKPRMNKIKNIGRHTISSLDNFLMQSIQIKPNNFKNIEYIPLKKVGDEIESAPNDKAGILFVELKSKDKLKKIEKFSSQIKILYD